MGYVHFLAIRRRRQASKVAGGAGPEASPATAVDRWFGTAAPTPGPLTDIKFPTSADIKSARTADRQCLGATKMIVTLRNTELLGVSTARDYCGTVLMWR